MSDSNEEIAISLPPPPGGKDVQAYYLVYGEWVVITKEPTIATLENPNPQGRMMQHTMSANEVINIHPVVFTLMQQGERPGYKIKWAMSIPKGIFKWYMEATKIIRDAKAKAKEAAETKDATPAAEGSREDSAARGTPKITLVRS